jgi:hypothetical protein
MRYVETWAWKLTSLRFASARTAARQIATVVRAETMESGEIRIYGLVKDHGTELGNIRKV